MLWNEFLVGGLLPTTHGAFQLSFKSVYESNDIVAAFKRRIPSNVIDDICKFSIVNLGDIYISQPNYLPLVGRSLFSPAFGSYSGEHFADLIFEARLLRLVGIGMPLVLWSYWHSFCSGYLKPCFSMIQNSRDLRAGFHYLIWKLESLIYHHNGTGQASRRSRPPPKH